MTKRVVLEDDDRSFLIPRRLLRDSIVQAPWVCLTQVPETITDQSDQLHPISQV